MPSNNSKYTQEFRDRTVKHILGNGKSATSVAEEMGIDTNTVCRWVRDYRRKNHLPSYEQSKGIKRVTDHHDKAVNQQLKERDKRIRNLEEEVEILKKFLRIFMQPL